MLLVALILPPFIFTNPVFPTLPWKIPCVFPVKVTYKTSTKKNAKAKTKKLTYTMKVAKASVALSGDSAVAVGSTTKLKQLRRLLQELRSLTHPVMRQSQQFLKTEL